MSLSKAGRALPVKVILVESDALPRDWVLEYLDLSDRELGLLGLDIGQLKTKLESHPQVL